MVLVRLHEAHEFPAYRRILRQLADRPPHPEVLLRGHEGVSAVDRGRETTPLQHRRRRQPNGPQPRPEHARQLDAILSAATDSKITGLGFHGDGKAGDCIANPLYPKSADL